MDRSLPFQRLHSPLEPVAGWYRFALLLTGDAAAAEGILRAIFAVAPHELAQLRTKERQMAWMIHHIRSHALNGQQMNPVREVSSFAGRVAQLPEPSRTLFALFHSIEGSLEEWAEWLGLGNAAAIQALACARQELAPGAVFPEKALLKLHRPWGGDGAKVARAVRAARDDPQFAVQLAADLQWHAEIERMEIPEGIELLYLAESPKPGWGPPFLQPTVLAIALALAVVMGVLVYFAKTEMNDFPGKEKMIALVEDAGLRKEPPFEEISLTEAAKLDDWFALKNLEGFAVPKELQKAKVVGCRVIKKEGAPMAEIALEKQNARLLIFRAVDLKDEIEKGKRHLFQQEEWAVAVWSEQENGYLLMFQGDVAQMTEFLESAGRN
ncbi:MAG: hypothetical protein NTZ46_07200 [Verrucomicrobia bacterium]|nr:hypothetical protein [Verrucomicrobiota bacterium]